jgi:histidine triad (HIT) family protein
MEGCFICEKHRAVDAIVADEHTVVSHLLGEDVYLGYLFVEPRRHVRELGELDPDEAASFGRAAQRASAALLAEGAEHVYAAVIGHHVDHLHLHLIARYPGAPPEYWWTRVDEWPDAARGGAEEIAALSERLRRRTR